MYKTTRHFEFIAEKTLKKKDRNGCDIISANAVSMNAILIQIYVYNIYIYKHSAQNKKTQPTNMYV